MAHRLFIGLVLLSLFIQPVSAQLTGNYNIIVEENGNALVVLVVTGIGTINMPLPIDVVSPAVKDALYVQSKNGVEVAIDAGGSSTIVYKSALLTGRMGQEWQFKLELPEFTAASIILSIPENTNVLSTSPNAAISHVGKSKNIIWNVFPSNNTFVKAKYMFTEPTQTTLEKKQEDDEGTSTDSWLFTILITLIIPLSATLLFVLLLYRRTRKGSLVFSNGVQNVLKTLTGNEVKVITLLLDNGGGMKRNDLERKARIPKSSLASTLHNLEKRNIIQVNKEYTVHFVELTEWFKSL